MARKTNVQYKYKISAHWIHGNEEVEIDSSYISYVFIDRDYDSVCGNRAGICMRIFPET